MLGWVFSPLAWIMGVPWKDCTIIGQLIGEKTVLNEFVAYMHMSQWAAANAAAPMDRRSFMIGIHALCGFANFLSIAIQIGGPSSLGAGVGFGQISATGAATLDGALNVTLLNGYSPTTNDAYAIVLSGTRAGTYNSVASGGGGSVWHMACSLL